MALNSIVNMIRRLFSAFYPPKPGINYKKTIGILAGDGIGPEVMSSAVSVLQHVNAPLNFEYIEDFDVNDDTVIERMKSFDAIMKGTIQHLVAEGAGSPNMVLRKKLDVFANVVHAYSLEGVETKYKDVDIITVRENLEGEYSGLEHEIYPGVVESIKVITRPASLRIAEYAFQLAHLNNRRKVTAVHKANIMKLVDGEFLKATREVAQKYPTIKYEEMIVDNTSMQMASNPNQFDVLVLPNLYGAIILNIAAYMVGGPGVSSGVNLSDKVAIFEQGTRHTGGKVAGKNLANPTAMMLSSVMMLRHLQLPHFADRIQEGVLKTLKEGRVRTADIGGSATTTKFTEEVINNIS